MGILSAINETLLVDKKRKKALLDWFCGFILFVSIEVGPICFGGVGFWSSPLP